MSSDIEVVEEVQSRNQQPAASGTASAGGELGEESLRDDVYTTAAFGDLEKLHRLVEQEGCSVSEPDGLGYYALQWAALNNRTAAAQYIIEISRNITTHEMANTMRYSCLRGAGGRFRNPYDHGIKKNCTDFLINGYNEDVLLIEESDNSEGIGMINLPRLQPSQQRLVFSSKGQQPFCH